MFYSTTHSTHYIYGYIASDMVENHSDSRVLGLFFVFLGGRGGGGCCCFGSDRSFMVDPLSYISFQPVFHD